jgi:hypothetical protein
LWENTQNVAQTHSCKYQYETFSVKKWPIKLGRYCKLKKLAKANHRPRGKNFAQSGHPDARK